MTRLPASPRLTLSLPNGRIRTVIWATGYAPDFGLAKLPIFDRKGELRHSEGIVGPGLYVFGLPFQMRGKSALIEGVGADAEALATHLAHHLKIRAA